MKQVFLLLLMSVIISVISFISEIETEAIDIQEDNMEIKKLLLPEANSKPRSFPITHIMLHFISNVYQKPDCPYRVVDIYDLFYKEGLSSHYLIDRDGEIFQLVSENRVAYHAGKSSLPDLPFFEHMMNEYSIGIELMAIGTKEEMVTMITETTYDALDPAAIGYTEQQYTALSKLLQQLYHRYPTISQSRFHVIGHEDYAAGRKVDPGELFDWGKIGY
ncbi:N-acetylmuramoyl-L-alanine amidase [Ornithinibacillus xuwenensis]|uniref:N-acetylmuramoyl-L-alanine amidase n=1 Tax=Ornithinibacillus xuwenensis TaxID=3144668 RepID=A0ABU9XIQ7_9BACI